MLEIRDYGFAAYLRYSEVEYAIRDTLIYFDITELSYNRLLKEYRASPFYKFDRAKRELNKKLKSRPSSL